MVTPVHDLLQH